MRNYITILLLSCSHIGISQSTNKITSDYRDAFLGYYQGYNYPYYYILVEKDTLSVDSLFITDTLWSEAPRLDCPITCNKHRVILNTDSSWTGFASYNGNFIREDTIHLFYMAPGPFAYSYDGKRISPIGFYSLDKKDKGWYVFPNPATNELHVILPGLKEELHLQLLDINGRLIMEQQFNTSTKLMLGTLPRSVYILKLKGKDVNLSKRVVLVE